LNRFTIGQQPHVMAPAVAFARRRQVEATTETRAETVCDGAGNRKSFNKSNSAAIERARQFRQPQPRPAKETRRVLR